jgi:hypothetical protein
MVRKGAEVLREQGGKRALECMFGICGAMHENRCSCRCTIAAGISARYEVQVQNLLNSLLVGS